MEYSTLEEIYGNSRQEIKTDGNNMNFPPKEYDSGTKFTFLVLSGKRQTTHTHHG